MTPHTAVFFHAAYTVAAVIYGTYIVTLLRRSASVRERVRRQGKAERG
ncbi:MAG TPA: hypothetical protein VF166_04010 [Gemmatimonadaceae bacterium]